MSRRPGIRLPRAAALGLAALLPLVCGAAGRAVPRWWDIEVVLAAKGRYSVTERGTAYTGEYSLREAWGGSMERDQDDYRLFHSRQERLEWTFREEAGAGDSVRTVTEKDFPAGPSFRVIYVLKDGRLVRFSIVVDDFAVPKSAPAGAFELALPRSRGYAPGPGAPLYDDQVSEGTNEIAVEEKDLLEGLVERVFRWEWKGYQPSPATGSAVALFNVHEAEVRIRVTPRY